MERQMERERTERERERERGRKRERKIKTQRDSERKRKREREREREREKERSPKERYCECFMTTVEHTHATLTRYIHLSPRLHGLSTCTPLHSLRVTIIHLTCD